MKKHTGIDKFIRILFAVSSVLTFRAAYADERFCDDADHCVWIMENHGPHEFDYDILTKELEAFGADGKAFLIMLVGDKDSIIAGRAIDILTMGDFDLTRAEGADIVRAWPGSNVDKMAKLMIKVGSLDVQSAMIGSLLHEDKNVRGQARNVLSKMRANKRIYQLRDFEYGPIARAVVEEPTRELVQMLAAFPKEKTLPILKRVLETTDTPSIIAAYDALYEADKDMAFQTLLNTLRNLGEDQVDTGFALAGLLKHRHLNRSDGFYLKFAKELAEDPKMSLVGRVAGLDAIINRALPIGQKNIQLQTTEPVLSALQTALNAKGNYIHLYGENFAKVASENPEIWAQLIWQRLQKEPLSYGSRFFTGLNELSPDQTSEILKQALSEDQDIYYLSNAIAVTVTQGQKGLSPSLNALENHWSDWVATIAKLSIKALKDGKTDYDKVVILPARKMDHVRSCEIDTAYSKDYVKQLPYFYMQENEPNSLIKRRYVKAAYPTKEGWIVGFGKGEWGGDLRYFDNDTGQSQSISELLGKSPGELGNIVAIMPISKPRLGSYASQFWIVEESLMLDIGLLYRLIEGPAGFEAELVAPLPGSGFRLKHLSNNRYLLAHDNHSPIMLSPAGKLSRACPL